MKTILFTGQSNTVGRGEGGAFPANSRVKVWNNQNDRDDLAALGTAFISANRAAAPFVNSRNNLGYHAACYLADMLGEDVHLIIVAKGAQPISKWAKTGPLYKRIKAVLAAAGVAAVDAFLWHQGEGDEGASSTYAAKFNQLLADLQSDGITTVSTPVIVGETSATHPNINAVLRGLEGGRIRCARTQYLSTFDGTHFDGASLPRAGWQYAKRLRDFFLTPWGPSMSTYVYAAGFSAIKISSSSNVKVPLEPIHGNSAWISNGSFLVPAAGVYRFAARGYAGGGKARLKLLDAAGSEIEIMAYSGIRDEASNNPILSGSAVLDLAAGDVVSLGLMHGKGSASSLLGTDSAKHNRLLVELIQAYA